MTLLSRRLIALFWLAVIGLLYYAAFPPAGLLAGLPRISGLSLSFKPFEHLFCLFLFVAAANGWAGFLWSDGQLSHLERFLFAAASGFGLMSLLTLFFTAVGLTGSLLYFVMLLAGFVFFIAAGKNLHGMLSSQARTLALLSAIPLLSALIGALAPPTQFDSLVYHLALPADYLRAGKMYAVPENFFFSFPQGMEMLFQMALKVDGHILANLMHWAFLPLGALAVYSFSHKFWGHKEGLAGAMIWLTTPAVMFVSTGTYVDLAVAFYVFTSFYAFVLWKTSGRNFYLYLCAALSGLACGVKYTAFMNVFLTALLIIVSGSFRNGAVEGETAAEGENLQISAQGTIRHHRRGKAYRFKACLKYAAIVIAVFSPWILKNLVYLKNPFAPWGAALFPSSLVAADQANAYFRHIGAHGVSVGSIKDLVLMPWQLTFHGLRFGGGFDVIGPVFLLFLPTLFLRSKIDKIEKLLLLYCALYAAAWLATGKVMRFLLPLIPFLSILSGRGISFLYREASKPYRLAVAAVLALAFSHNLLIFHWIMASVDPYSASVSGVSEPRYLAARLNYYKAAEDALNKLGPGTKTLFLGETRSYYCNNNFVAPTDFDTNPLVSASGAALSPEGLEDALKEYGYTHIFVNNFEFQRLSLRNKFTDKGFKNWLALRKNRLKAVYRDRFCELYEIIN
jgi:hypothetical protein